MQQDCVVSLLLSPCSVQAVSDELVLELRFQSHSLRSIVCFRLEPFYIDL